jgi:hypothetical protein
MANAIVKISKRAKAIRKAHPQMAWKSAIKKASSEYRGGSLGKAKKHAPKKKHHAKAVKGVGRVKSAHAHQTTAGLKAKLRQQLEGKLAALSVRHFKANTVRETEKVAKEMSRVKKELRKYL